MPAPSPKKSLPPWLSATLREPLVHFLAAAALLLIAQHFFGRPVIAISAPTLNGLRKDFEMKYGHAPSPQEFEKVTADYLEDEILFREGLRSGMAQDNRVRAILVQTVRTSMRPIVPTPTDEQLQTLRNESPETYRFPPRLGFEHVSFSKASDIPPGLLEKLKAGAPREEYGEPLRIANPLPPTFRTQLDHTFGRDFTENVRKCEPGVWSGPFNSTRGVHLVRVTSAEGDRDMPLAEIRPTLVAKWNQQHESAAITARVAELRKGYRVELPTAAQMEKIQ